MRTMLLLLLLCNAALAQSVTVETKIAFTGLKNVEVLEDFVFVSETSVPTLQNVAVIRVAKDAPEPTVTVSDISREPVQITKLQDNRTFIVSKAGKIWIKIIGIDFETKKFLNEEVTYTLQPLVPPEPPQPPAPTVPVDNFDNIGQRVQSWTVGLPSNLAIGKIYQDAAYNLRFNPNSTITEESNKTLLLLRAVPDYAKYATFAINLNTDIGKRWPLSKGVLSDYWKCVGLGLGVPSRN
jgi:hypothetical protein